MGGKGSRDVDGERRRLAAFRAKKFPRLLSWRRRGPRDTPPTGGVQGVAWSACLAELERTKVYGAGGAESGVGHWGAEPVGRDLWMGAWETEWPSGGLPGGRAWNDRVAPHVGGHARPPQSSQPATRDAPATASVPWPVGQYVWPVFFLSVRCMIEGIYIQSPFICIKPSKRCSNPHQNCSCHQPEQDRQTTRALNPNISGIPNEGNKML